MKKYIRVLLMVVLLGCADTDLENLSNPSTSKVLANEKDYIRVLDGGALAFWNAIHKDNPYMTLSVAADHGTSSWGNFGMREVGTVGKPYGLGNHNAINNTITAAYKDFLEDPYENLYAIVSSVNDVLIALNKAELSDASSIAETEAYAYLLRGIGYGYLGLLYDQALIVTENDVDSTKITFEDFSPYSEVIDQALTDLDVAIAKAQVASDISVKGFPGLTIDQTIFLEIANSYAAKFLMHSARNDAETQSVDWRAVKNYAEKGLKTFDLAPQGDGGTVWWHSFFRQNNSGWMRVDQKIINMVNPSSPYPYPNSGYGSDSVALVNADRRFDGSKFKFAGSSPFRPGRGVYFFSFWRYSEYDDYKKELKSPMPSLEARENKLNLAEALIRLGESGASDIINETRVGAGRKDPATDGDADLMDKLFYERYLEAYEGPGNPFFDRRRTDDLGKNQFLEFPIPAKELNSWNTPLYTFGG